MGTNNIKIIIKLTNPTLELWSVSYKIYIYLLEAKTSRPRNISILDIY